MSETASITLNGKTLELPVITGTENEKAIDISQLRQQTGYITLDPGFKNTGATKSAITFLDGEKGTFKINRGYKIEDLAEKSTFLEVAYLLIYGELPTKEVLEKFKVGYQIPNDGSRRHEKFLRGIPIKISPYGSAFVFGRCFISVLSRIFKS